jgi:beta-barrel assembly-enhancing protease
MRLSAAVAALTLSIAAVCAPAQDNRLPDIGSSAGEILNPAQQAEYGSMLLSQLRYYGYILEDPLIDGWVQSVGNRLAASSDEPDHPFTFFMLKDRQFNAFATLGGYIGANAGLILAAETEDEVASVLSHEIAHVTQEHVLRSVERAQKDSIPILLAMLGAVAAASAAGGNSADDGAMAAIAVGQGLAAQRQIDYTRSNEAEADRLGIRTLARSGYDPAAMASMFQRMQAVSRVNQGGERERTPDYLRTHPVTTTRISEVKQRAEGLKRATPQFGTGQAGASDHPLLPSGLKIAGASTQTDDRQFGWARERIRVMTANTPDAAIREYQRSRAAGKFNDAQRYGLAIARLRNSQYAAAIEELDPLLARFPDDPWLVLGTAEAEARSGKTAQADARIEALLKRMPNHRAVALTYAQLLSERNTAAAGQRAQTLLRPLLAVAKDDPIFQRTFARASEVAGETVRAGEAHAEAEYLNGRPERALVQLNTLLKRDDVDYYARARIEARIAAITPRVLELRRQGVRDEELGRRRVQSILDGHSILGPHDHRH